VGIFVTQATDRGKLKYATAPFFEFVKKLEAVCTVRALRYPLLCYIIIGFV